MHPCAHVGAIPLILFTGPCCTGTWVGIACCSLMLCPFSYFDSIFESIKDAGDEGPQCPICLGESVSLAFPDCGHFVCRECMGKWVGGQSGGSAGGAPCPTCRKQLNSTNIVYFAVNTGSAGDELATMCGAKPAALARQRQP